jgi:hypothetical protein
VVLLAFSDSTRIALLVGGVWLALMTCVYYLWLRPRARRAAVADTAPQVVCGEGQGLSDEQDPGPVWSPCTSDNGDSKGRRNRESDGSAGPFAWCRDRPRSCDRCEIPVRAATVWDPRQ